MGQDARRGFVSAGTWVCDHNMLIEAWPQEDSLTEVLSFERRGGGSACNFAIDMRRLDPDMPVETIGLVGDDADGRLLLALADEAGVNRRQLTVTGAAGTAATSAYSSRSSGRRTHIYNSGCGGLLTPDHFDLSTTRGRILHLGLPGVHEVMDAPWGEDANGWVTVLRRARAAGLTTNLELASITAERLAALTRPCLPYLDLAVVNDVEIGSIAGEVTAADGQTDVAAVVRAARSVMANSVAGLVVAHFPRGAVAVTRAGAVVSQPSVRVPSSAIVAANGAGDAFAAGFLYGFHADWALKDALALGHAAAAASLRDISTSDAVSPWRECLELASNWGWRDPVMG